VSGGPAARVALIGFMGSGKSTVGRLIAGRLGWLFVDLDMVIEEHAGMPIPELFAARGEAGFRALESRCLAELSSRERIVVAAGGGTPIAEENRAFFTGAATFLLAVSLSAALQRTGGDAGRPLLARGEEALARMYAERLPVYRSLGREIQSEGRSAEEVAEEILAVLGPTIQGQGPG
jgi:shikimate kinase